MTLFQKRLFTAITVATLSAVGVTDVRATTPPAQMSKLHWRSVGPYVGGRVVAVAGVPQQPNRFYMGTVGGGIWTSTDYGVRWTNLSDGKLPGDSASIGALAVAPSDPSIIYAGTGECDIRNDTIPGDGIYKSTDGGKSWQYSGLRATRTSCAIAVDPFNPEIVYDASMGTVYTPNSEGGVYKSMDGGKTWSKILSGNSLTGAIDVVMQPGHPEELYAALWQAQRTPWGLTNGGSGSGLYKSTDGGAQWTNLSHHAGMPAGVLGRIGVAVTAADPQRVYAIIQAEHGGVFRSFDGGESWRRVNRTWMLRERSFYYSRVFADPKNPDLIYAPEVDLWVSHDGGKIFTRLRPPHGDNHAVWINPDHPNIVIEGNDGGATVSTNYGKTWTSEDDQPTGEMYHVNIDKEFPFHIYGAQQDEGASEAPSAMPGGIRLSAWQREAGGEATRVVPEPGRPWINFGSGYFDAFTRRNHRTDETISVTPWPDFQDGLGANLQKYRFGWTHAITFSAVNPKQLLVGAQYVLQSLDYGLTWTRISPDLTHNDPATEVASGGPIMDDQSGAETYPGIQTIAVSPLDGQEIWAGSDDGLAHITRDGGKSWQNVTPPQLPQKAWISCIEPSYTAAGTAFLTARRYMQNDDHPYVYETTNFGQSWTPLTNGIPDNDYVFDLRQDRNVPNLLFLATSTSVYISLNGGQLWQPLQLNMPTVQVRDVRIDNQQGQVAIATHGRAFWVLDNLTVLEQLSRDPSAGSSNPNMFAPEKVWLTPAYGRGFFGGRGGSGENPPFGATVFFTIPKSYDGSTAVSLTFANTKGQTIRSFKLHLKKPAKKGPRAAAAQPSVQPGPPHRRNPLQALTAITPGENRFQWDLRYPPAPKIGGKFKAPTGVGVPYSMNGPVIIPGRYTVTLDYGGQKLERGFTVALDPRIHPAPGALAARLGFELEIHHTLIQLDQQVNQAIAARAKLEKNASGNADKISALTSALATLVNMKLRGDETDLVFGTTLHQQLAYVAGQTAEGYRAPSPQARAAYTMLAAKIAAGEQALSAAMVNAGAH
ncbi:MAG: WD40/YVTN/BNR-like repeat-containing protein [Terriglobales bacterium]